MNTGVYLSKMDIDFFLLLQICIVFFSFLVMSFFLVSNKSYLEIERQSLPNHIERGFFTAIKLSGIGHGYSGFFLTYRYFLRRLRSRVGVR